MKTLGLSMWYGDAGRHLAERAIHLLKKPGVDRWVWSVRPDRDVTQQFLQAVVEMCGKKDSVEIIVEDGPQPEDRMERLSFWGDRMLDKVTDETHVLWHESDLLTEDDLVPRLAAMGAAAAGGWVTLGHNKLKLGAPINMSFSEPPQHYDTYGYRKDGVRFKNQSPYHACYCHDKPFELDSVGSVVLLDAYFIRLGCRMRGKALVGLCDEIRQAGGVVMCDPTVPVCQPIELWRFNDD